jgi:flagellar M-ring protein FliF
MVKTMREPLLLPAGAASAEEISELRGGGRGNELGGSAETGAVAELKSRAEGVFEEVAGHIRRDPVYSTKLLESWISADGDD